MSSINKKVIKQIIIVVAVLLIGLIIFKVLSLLRKPPAKKPQVVTAPLLNAQRIESEDIQVVVDGFGDIKPKVEVQIIPQVSGRVVGLHENFVNGGFFRAGEALITIDPNDYELAVETANAAVRQAEVAYQRELAEQKVALEEWELLNPGEDPNSPLLTRELQVRGALAELKSAEAKLESARLDLKRTVISVPFGGRVQQKNVDVGQYVTVGTPVAEVYGTDAVEVIVQLADNQLKWFDVPIGFINGPITTAGKGSKAEVIAEFAGDTYSWQGEVARTQGRIDEVSRMVQVVIEVENPFRAADKPPLIPGMFVEVDIYGKKLQDVFLVPRFAVHNGNEVWIEKDGRLRIVKVKIVRTDKDYAYVTEGLEDGDVIVTSPLDVVTDGMRIRTPLSNDADEKRQGETEKDGAAKENDTN